MYTVCVRGHVMIAHSFRGELFGPAQRLHGATYVVDVEFRRPELGHEGVVAKRLDAPYQPGRRSPAWCKIKPAGRGGRVRR